MMQRPTSFREVRYLITSDVYRYRGQCGLSAVLKECLWGIGGRFTIWMRLARYLQQKGRVWLPLYAMAKLLHRHYMFKFGIAIPIAAQIGPGLYIGHFGAIVVSHLATIGYNCNLSHGVTIAAVFRGRRSGAPVIGNNVYFGPGSKVVGKVVIGDNVAVGANCVVTHDVPDNAVVVGVPGKVISSNGSEGYILNAVRATLKA